MNSHIDYSIIPEAIYSTDVLVRADEPEPLMAADAMQQQLVLSSTIDYLRNDLISLYVSAEQIHWHLRVKQREAENWYAYLGQAEVARQLSGCILHAIARSICLKRKLAGESECDELLKAVLALQAENDALERENQLY